MVYHVLNRGVGRMTLFETREDGELSEVLRWMTVTHTQRWHAFHGTSGTGPIYQGRFKSFPVESDEHFWTVARYYPGAKEAQ
jgi:hypothetical protein